MSSFNSIHTKRLILRSIHPKDANRVFLYRSDNETNKFQGWIPSSIEDVIEFIENKTEPEFNIPDTWHQLVIIKNDTYKIIGDIGIHFLEKESNAIELGCTLAKDYQSNGYALESLHAIIQILKDSYNKSTFRASIDQRNIKSKHLIERLGFEHITTHEESSFHQGEWTNDEIYELKM